MWYVYIIQASDGTLYTGITTDLSRRLKEHNTDNHKGSKYLRGKRPVKLIYSTKVSTRSEASKREYEIKKLKRHEKKSLLLLFNVST
jgi:putative endonuclease